MNNELEHPPRISGNERGSQQKHTFDTFPRLSHQKVLRAFQAVAG